MKKIFITGSTGFVGKHLTLELQRRGEEYVAGNRALYGDLATQENWEALLQGCESVIHLAARVHVMNDTSLNPLDEFKRMNVKATLNIARAAKKVGVKKFIFISSIKVNGEETFKQPFSASDTPHPQDFYGLSKKEAEDELLKMHEPGSFEVTVIRPPLVYGPGVKANFEKLFRLVDFKIPMPFGLVKNKRSLVSVFNLIDLILTALSHPRAGGEIFMVSDDHDVSLGGLIQLMAHVQGKKVCLLPIPPFLMKGAAIVLGKKSYADRLFGNLQVDIKKTKELLAWQPRYSFEDTFKKVQ